MPSWRPKYATFLGGFELDMVLGRLSHVKVTIPDDLLIHHAPDATHSRRTADARH